MWLLDDTKYNISKTALCNTSILKEIKRDKCKLIVMPSIYFDYNNFDMSIKELQKREVINDVDIKLSP